MIFKRLNFRSAKLSENGSDVMSEIDGIRVMNKAITTSDTDVVHNLGRTPNFVFITPLGNGVVWVVSKGKGKITLKASSAISVDLLIV